MSEQKSGTGTSGMAIAGLVLGILAAVSSWIPIVNNLSFVIAALGAILSVVGVVATVRGKKAGKGLAIAALVVNVVAIAIVLATQSAMSAAIDEATQGIVSTEDVSAPAGDDAEQAGSAAEQPYSITDVEMTGDSYSTTISGTFTNDTDEEITYVQVSYRLLDAEGAQIATAYANTNNLAAGGTWKFEATGFKPLSDVASFELADVTGF